MQTLMADNQKGKMTFEEVRFWVEEAKSCEERQRKEFSDRNFYPLLIKYYEGSMYPDDAARQRSNLRKLTFINEYFPNVNALISEIMYQNPEIIVTESKPASIQAMQKFKQSFPEDTGVTPQMVMTSALNYAWNKLDAISECRLGLFDMIMAGYCAIEINHINNPATEQQAPVGNKEKTSIIGQIGNAIKKATGQEEIEEEVQKTMPVKEIAYATPDETYIRRWDPLHVLLDYRADRLKDMRYIIKKVHMSNAEFAARYPEYADKVKAGAPMPFALHTEEKHNKSTMLYEFQVKQKGDKYVNFLISPNYLLSEIDYWERPYTTNGFNMKIGALHEYGKLYPISIASINKAIQDDINNYATFMMETAERNIPKIGYNDNVTEEGIRSLQSPKVNDLVKVKGTNPPSNSITPIQPTSVSRDNENMLALFDKTKNKLWSISEERMGQNSRPEFAEQLKIQDAGFMARQADIQEGLRKLIRTLLDGVKDVIVTYWDGPMFFKITGGPKPVWYIPKQVPNPMQQGSQMVENPLTDILTGDYEIDIDITSALKPNKERKKEELIKFATWITSPPVMQFAMMQGYTIDIEVIKKAATEWGWNADNIIKNIKDAQPQGMPGAVPMPGMQPEGMPPVGGALPAPTGLPNGNQTPPPPEKSPVRLSLSLSLTPQDLLNHSVVKLLQDGGIDMPMPPADLVAPQLASAHKKTMEHLAQPLVQPTEQPGAVNE